LKNELKIKNILLINGVDNSLIIIRAERTMVPEIVKILNKNGVGTIHGIIDILSLKASIPDITLNEEEPAGNRKKFVSNRISIEEIKKNIEDSSKLSFDFFIFIFLSALVAGVGLILNSSTIIIASMILSPLMSPILGVSFGIVIKDVRMVKIGFLEQILGFLISIGTGILLGLIALIILTPPIITTEMLARGFPNLFDLIVAVCSGIAVGIGISGSIKTSLIGVAIAVALMPPAVNIGLAIIYNDPLLSLGSLILLFTNIIAINICALIVFKLKKITSVRKAYIFWEGTKALPDHINNV
jgi:uncharacterized hydrophobic protein (TIGR00271 family)